MQEVCRYAVVHCFTFFHLTWLRRLAFILDIAAWNLLFMLTLYISFLTVVTSVLYHLSIALTLTFLILLNLNLPLPPCFSFSSLLILSSLFSLHPIPLLSSSFHPSSLTTLSLLFYNSFCLLSSSDCQHSQMRSRVLTSTPSESSEKLLM